MIGANFGAFDATPAVLPGVAAGAAMVQKGHARVTPAVSMLDDAYERLLIPSHGEHLSVQSRFLPRCYMPASALRFRWFPTLVLFRLVRVSRSERPPALTLYP